jgi:hypothetical protein
MKNYNNMAEENEMDGYKKIDNYNKVAIVVDRL